MKANIRSRDREMLASFFLQGRTLMEFLLYFLERS